MPSMAFKPQVTDSWILQMWYSSCFEEIWRIRWGRVVLLDKKQEDFSSLPTTPTGSCNSRSHHCHQSYCTVSHLCTVSPVIELGSTRLQLLGLQSCSGCKAQLSSAWWFAPSSGVTSRPQWTWDATSSSANKMSSDLSHNQRQLNVTDREQLTVTSVTCCSYIFFKFWLHFTFKRKICQNNWFFSLSIFFQHFTQHFCLRLRDMDRTGARSTNFKLKHLPHCDPTRIR